MKYPKLFQNILEFVKKKKTTYQYNSHFMLYVQFSNYGYNLHFGFYQQ